MKASHILLLTFVLSAPFLHAEEDYTSLFYPSWYGDFHLGQLEVEANVDLQDFSYLAVGGSFGYQFTENFGTELFMSFSSNGKQHDFLSSIVGRRVKAEFGATGLYFTAKTDGTFYFKGRVGLASSRFTYSASQVKDETKSSNGFSAGGAIGLKTDRLNFELGYMVFPEADDPIFTDVNYDSSLIMLSVGTAF